jgi:hypothetical protein
MKPSFESFADPIRALFHRLASFLPSDEEARPSPAEPLEHYFSAALDSHHDSDLAHYLIRNEIQLLDYRVQELERGDTKVDVWHIFDDLLAVAICVSADAHSGIYKELLDAAAR